MDRNLLVAVAHFPDREHAIEELARTNEEFCSLCTDLAEAKAALTALGAIALPSEGFASVGYRWTESISTALGIAALKSAISPGPPNRPAIPRKSNARKTTIRRTS